jgi:hypothetical protein
MDLMLRVEAKGKASTAAVWICDECRLVGIERMRSGKQQGKAE